MKVRHVRLAAREMIAGLDLPETARVVSCSLDEPAGEVVVAVEDESFAEVGDGERVPTHGEEPRSVELVQLDDEELTD